MEAYLSTEVENICGIGDFLFDENTRKSFIKEAEFYQLDRMKDILAFKSTTSAPVDDEKKEVINIIEKVIRNKVAFEDVLKYRDCTRRRLKEMQVLDLNLTDTVATDDIKKVTTKNVEFENAQWDHITIENVNFKHSTCFKNCSFLGLKLKGCKFSNLRIDFHNCHLIFTDFYRTVQDHRSSKAVVDFDGSDLQATNFKEMEGIGCGITNGSVKITNAKHIEKELFDDDALRAIIGRVKIFSCKETKFCL